MDMKHVLISTTKHVPKSRIKRRVKCCGCLFVVVVLLFGIVWLATIWVNGWSIRWGLLARSGRQIANALRENNAYPTNADATAFTNTLQALKFDRQGQFFQRFFVPEAWTVVNNLREDPPGNLVVLVTRNIDPSSLRTQLSTGDMQRHIQFVRGRNLPRLGSAAVLVRADGKAIPIINRKSYTVYANIYDGQPFDFVTNSATGLPVGYLTPDGKVVIPTND